MCSIDINECITHIEPCLNNGRCVNTDGSFHCLCSNTGYQGSDCSVDVNECDQNNTCSTGDCVNTQGSYVCNCDHTGFTGEKCENDIDECFSAKPCKNGGICNNTIGSYVCSCDITGYTGYDCTIDTDECQIKSPCKHGGICNNTIGSYVCSCNATGFTGHDCTIDTDECHMTKPCKNGGICNNTIGSYVCSCDATGYTGNRCTVDINECETSSPCQNGGSCNNTDGEFICSCDGTGYQGPNCTDDVNECLNSPDVCQQTSNCINTQGSYYCQMLSTKVSTEHLTESSKLPTASPVGWIVGSVSTMESTPTTSTADKHKTITIGPVSESGTSSSVSASYAETASQTFSLLSTEHFTSTREESNGTKTLPSTILVNHMASTSITASNELKIQFMGTMTAAQSYQVTQSMKNIVQRFLCAAGNDVHVEDVEFHRNNGDSTFSASISCGKDIIGNQQLVEALGQLSPEEIKQMFPLPLVGNAIPTASAKAEATSQNWIHTHWQLILGTFIGVIVLLVIVVTLIHRRRKQRQFSSGGEVDFPIDSSTRNELEEWSKPIYNRTQTNPLYISNSEYIDDDSCRL